MATRRKRTGKNIKKAGKKKKSTKNKISKKKVSKGRSGKKSKKKSTKRKKSARRKEAGDVAAPESIARAVEAKPKGVVLTFTKDDKSPDDVRVTLRKPAERVLEAGDKTGKSEPREPGRVEALVEVRVSAPAGAGRTATIDVTNVTASPIRVDVPEGDAGRAVVTTLTILGDGE
jgi:hypothetical protein